MAKYNFFIAGRWRNRDVIKQVRDTVRASGKTAYCFIDNVYAGEEVEFRMDANPDEFMKKAESLPPDHPLMKKIFEADMAAERESDKFLIVFPAGLSAHTELGAAYGMGKQCYAFGEPEKMETLYGLIEEFIPDLPALEKWLETQ
jgi:hypothetical protein